SQVNRSDRAGRQRLFHDWNYRQASPAQNPKLRTHFRVLRALEKSGGFHNRTTPETPNRLLLQPRV
ncbi:MAG: hypothetical protein ACLGIY_16240, partial [Betaproteobacteria bacterium]